MSNYERNFKGVWIPADIWLNTGLSIQEKIMLVEIDSLNACPNRGCWAGNEHFAKFFGLSKSRVSEVITSLTKKGYLRVVFQRQGKQITERNIFTVTPFGKQEGVFGKDGEPLRDPEDPPSGNAEGNNTNFNNTDNTNKPCPVAKKTATTREGEAAFDLAWQHYPKREGSNPKNHALSAWKARLTEGHTPEVMLTGLRRYLSYCQTKGNMGTGFVMQAKRFFGPSLEFLNDWEVSANQGGGSGMVDPDDTSWIHGDWGY